MAAEGDGPPPGAATDPDGAEPASAADWWRTAVIYQIYPRSFADGNADGVGDLIGITERLDALVALGVDSVWLCPFYRSPQADAGYDVADYCDVDPLFGTLDDFRRLLARAHDLGLRVIIDLVPNHSSSAHPWFEAALAARPGSRERSRYIFRDQPTDWRSVFGGSAWTQVPDGQWYLHTYDVSQPDWNWANPDVVAFFDRVLHFWLDLGVDGFRVDVAHGLVKDASFPSFPDDPLSVHAKSAAPYWDQDGVHAIYRRWRALLDQYTEGDPSRPRVLCAEANVPVRRAVRYVRPDEMHQTFNFPYLNTPWNAAALHRVIEHSLAEYATVGAPSTWVLSNHDVVRHASRLGYHEGRPPRPGGIGPADPQPDEALGLRRARAATLLMLALPGSAYLYQGEELGLPEHTAMPDRFRQDPTWVRKNYTEPGRDGARVPLPWVSASTAFGFGGFETTWLPQPDSWAAYSRDQQEGVSTSTLELYRSALRLRRRYRLGEGTLEWLSGPDDRRLDFRRGELRVTCVIGDDRVPLPGDAEILLTSQEPFTGVVEPDTCVWWRLPRVVRVSEGAGRPTA
ncbi:MAG TPA: glycoside hydrolase family 13 protein [Microlunatus sp.]|nr:glycoside hydrolase family 13 protein [Microlunatus sp.]